MKIINCAIVPYLLIGAYGRVKDFMKTNEKEKRINEIDLMLSQNRRALEQNAQIMGLLQNELKNLREANEILHHENKYIISLMTILRERISELESNTDNIKQSKGLGNKKLKRDKFGRFIKCEK